MQLEPCGPIRLHLVDCGRRTILARLKIAEVDHREVDSADSEKVIPCWLIAKEKIDCQ
jgi:hypothetical protein